MSGKQQRRRRGRVEKRTVEADITKKGKGWKLRSLSREQLVAVCTKRKWHNKQLVKSLHVSTTFIDTELMHLARVEHVNETIVSMSSTRRNSKRSAGGDDDDLTKTMLSLLALQYESTLEHLKQQLEAIKRAAGQPWEL